MHSGFHSLLTNLYSTDGVYVYVYVYVFVYVYVYVYVYVFVFVCFINMAMGCFDADDIT